MNLLHFAALTIAQSGVRVKADSFRLNASDLKSIREEEELSRRNLSEMLDEYNRSNRQTAERIERTVALLFKGELWIPVQENRQIPIPDLDASWRSYGNLSLCQPEILEIRRRICAARIVRQNARFFSAAACANLLEDLEQEALSKIDQIANRCSDTPWAISFDDRLPATVSAQLRVTDGSATERIDAFLSRFEALSTRTLAHLAWFTVKACPLPEDHGNKSRATASA